MNWVKDVFEWIEQTYFTDIFDTIGPTARIFLVSIVVMAGLLLLTYRMEMKAVTPRFLVVWGLYVSLFALWVVWRMQRLMDLPDDAPYRTVATELGTLAWGALFAVLLMASYFVPNEAMQNRLYDGLSLFVWVVFAALVWFVCPATGETTLSYTTLWQFGISSLCATPWIWRHVKAELREIRGEE